MKVIAIGDLHAKAWPVFPTGPDGINGYLKLLKQFFTDLAQEVNKQGFTAFDYIIFLGDVADEPYKKGNISVEVLNTLLEGFTYLTSQTKAEVLVIRGNHDSVVRATKTGNVTRSWLPALQGIRDVTIAAEPLKVADVPIVCIPYSTPSQVQEWLEDPNYVKEGDLVLGHFVSRGTMMSNEIAYSTHDAVDISNCPATTFILGHAHVPQLFLNQKIVQLVGTPLPYSWADKHTGKIPTYEKEDNKPGWKKVSDWYPNTPMFVGPVNLEELRDVNSGLRVGSFVRLLVKPNDKSTLQIAKNEFPALRIFPQIDNSTEDEPEAEARIAALAQCLDGTSPDVTTGALQQYIAYHKDKSAQGMDLKTLLNVGKELLGLDSEVKK